MLRVGLTGGLGSGKSTVAAVLRELGAHVLEADAIGRTLMEPGQAVYDQIVRAFGPEVVNADATINRPRLAELAFAGGRLEELNAIVHPAVIAAQMEWMDHVFARDPAAVAVVESALIFEVERDAIARGEKEGSLAGAPGDSGYPLGASAGLLANWRRRFDYTLLLTAPDELKIARYVARTNPDPARREAAVADARMRLATQMPDREKAERADFVIDNTADLDALRMQVAAVWERFRAESNNRSISGSLE